MKNIKNTLHHTIKKVVASIVLATLSTISAHAQAAGDATHGEQLSQTCLGCHGAPGLRNPGPVYNIPVFGGQHPEYIVSALKAYKSKERSHGTMQAQASNLSEQDMADIAAYFYSIEGSAQEHLVDSGLAQAGEKKSAMCASCHGPNGKSDNAGYPILAGQYETYLAQALKDYRSGERKNPIMSGFAASLTIDDIKELSAWFAGQKDGLIAPHTKIFK